MQRFLHLPGAVVDSAPGRMCCKRKFYPEGVFANSAQFGLGDARNVWKYWGWDMLDSAKRSRVKKLRAPVESSCDILSASYFVAIDFETANRFRNSACAISVVRVEDGKIIDTFSQLIKPPVLHFEFTYIHGISEGDVVDAPTYDEVHDEVMKRIDGAGFIAAHNASFDKSVMNALCRHWGLLGPSSPWACTVKLARKTWNLHPAKLPNVCDHLGIPLKHHDATSDATACAKIVLAAIGR